MTAARQTDATTRWVERLNRLARDLDEDAATMHPSAWSDALGHRMERWRALAAGGPREPDAGQLELFAEKGA